MDGYVIGDSASRRRFATGLFVGTTLALLTSTALIIDTVAWANGELREALGNMTFPSEWTRSGQAPLVGGVYEEPTAQDSASKIVIRLTDSVAIGTIGGQTEAAVVIVTDPGGSGVFFDLYLVQKQENRWRVMDRAHLGDRIRVNTIEVERGLIGLDLTVHDLRDGTCCPTERSRVYYALHGERLIKVNAPAQHISNPIEGPVWGWQYAVRIDGTRTTPTEPGHYTLHLGPDGQLNVRANCNQAGGRYRLEGSHLTFAVTHSTMAACLPDSQDRQFLADLAAVSAWRLAGYGKTMLPRENFYGSHRWHNGKTPGRMLKKAVQQGRSERRGEEVHTALRVGRSPLEWILANGKSLPVLPTAEKSLPNVEPLSDARTKLADCFSILLGDSRLYVDLTGGRMMVFTVASQ